MKFAFRLFCTSLLLVACARNTPQKKQPVTVKQKAVLTKKKVATASPAKKIPPPPTPPPQPSKKAIAASAATDKKETAPTVKVAPKKVTKICIAIDPGHGGKDTGAKLIIAPYTREKIITLQTAFQVEKFLKDWGYEVILTRRKDRFVDLASRVEMAVKKNAQAFVSIHYNSTPKATTAKGIEIYYYPAGRSTSKDEKNRSRLSKELARSIMTRMAPVSKAASRGVRPGDFHVIRETPMPAVLVESGFLSNPEEAKKIKKPNYVRFLAWSMAKGIDDYIKKNGIK